VAVRFAFMFSAKELCRSWLGALKGVPIGVPQPSHEPLPLKPMTEVFMEVGGAVHPPFLVSGDIGRRKRTWRTVSLTDMDQVVPCKAFGR